MNGPDEAFLDFIANDVAVYFKMLLPFVEY